MPPGPLQSRLLGHDPFDLPLLDVGIDERLDRFAVFVRHLVYDFKSL